MITKHQLEDVMKCHNIRCTECSNFIDQSKYEYCAAYRRELARTALEYRQALESLVKAYTELADIYCSPKQQSKVLQLEAYHKAKMLLEEKE